MTDTDLKRYNNVFGQDLGFTSAGKPRFKWAKTKDLWYLIEAPVDMLTPSGVYVTINGYRKITWEQRMGPGWIVACWRSPGTQSEWKAKYGTMLPYPPEGMYLAIEDSLLPRDCEPSLLITLEAISKIKTALSEGIENTTRRLAEEADKTQAEQDQQVQDEIDSDWPAFNCEVVSATRGKEVQ